ncbi:major facilitator superfamily domain-containing protein 12-like [Homarus americanus]|uniref:major facilitator superfamily domain-containing protein 12-like n=1 Tax=Homarus americanus TaxID=6706 RepID=UPI001C462397|nr:major facilitator superfamily domain-containing protein 12-like [Homarus americanus]XP_042228946.1 major facilitator superfamily domain-containing protein 12-like [Homarus americanus]XP_042228947.1 major facilitator superfamily domain-containing protein 12-like [Homarus americanus]XP_042228948.1 major facilitator superfamily domain-containing protein 12-like [Homarus americanus]XP_042228949.1 major facilitator superfamily domain-containing protein 12-like [Homarus americanus]
MEKKSLPWTTKLCYGVGHVFNDLCASMWFTYLLIFYEKVLLFNPTMAGLVLLVGQIADGLSTPIVGIFSDKENKFPMCARYGRRKVWHLLGTVLVFISFPFIYNSCLGCEGANDWAQFAYYCVFVCLFQFGWACVQISHLALIPDLTSKKHQRTELNSIRYAFTVLANLSVFAITFVVLNISGDSDDNDDSTTTTTQSVPASEQNNIGPEDDAKFRNIALICCGVGAVFSFIFHTGVQEPIYISRKKQDMIDIEEKRPQRTKKMRKVDWFKEISFYQIAVLYMATRLYVNLYQVYIPLYVQETLSLTESYVATVPFAMYLAGFVGSLIMKEINKKIGRKATFVLGCCVGIAGCLWVWLGEGNYYSQWGIFLVAALLGIGGSTLLITSLSITADLIGDNVEGGAFVYGFMSLVDKFSNGIIIMVIQNSDTGEQDYYRSVITFACGSACSLGILVIVTLLKTKVGQRRGESPVLEILEDSLDSRSTQEGIDNPVISVISEDNLSSNNFKPDIYQLRATDTPSMCQCDIPAMCTHRQTKSPTSDNTPNGDLDQLPADKLNAFTNHVEEQKQSVCQLRAEDTPSMCKLGLSDVPKMCNGGTG